jgi:hypothetical protein
VSARSRPLGKLHTEITPYYSAKSGGNAIMERTIRRGDIFMADLNPIIGSEQGGIRPVLILSNNLGQHARPHRHRGADYKPKA